MILAPICTRIQLRPRSKFGPSDSAGGKRRRSWSTTWKKRAKSEHHETAEGETETAASDASGVDGEDVAAIQNDDRLTAADRVDLIANQVVAEQDDNKDPECGD